MDKFDFQSPTYTPQRFFARVYEACGIKTDTEFVRLTGFEQATISRQRHRREKVSYRIMVYAALATGLSIEEVYALAGVPLPEFTRKTK